MIGYTLQYIVRYSMCSYLGYGMCVYLGKYVYIMSYNMLTYSGTIHMTMSTHLDIVCTYLGAITHLYTSVNI